MIGYYEECTLLPFALICILSAVPLFGSRFWPSFWIYLFPVETWSYVRACACVWCLPTQFLTVSLHQHNIKFLFAFIFWDKMRTTPKVTNSGEWLAYKRLSHHMTLYLMLIGQWLNYKTAILDWTPFSSISVSDIIWKWRTQHDFERESRHFPRYHSLISRKMAASLYSWKPSLEICVTS